MMDEASNSLPVEAPTDESTEIDNIIQKLLSVRGSRPGKQVNLTENEIRMLCVRYIIYYNA